jgi:ABC-type transport system involved in cytochrome c biogenesis ATPase subunit
MANSLKSSLQLRAIEIEGLFGLYHHIIPLQEEHITIVHGPNGVGKTAILRLVEALFLSRGTSSLIRRMETKTDAMDTLCEIPFSTLRLIYKNGASFHVRQKKANSKSGTQLILLSFAFVNTEGEEKVRDFARPLKIDVDQNPSGQVSLLKGLLSSTAATRRKLTQDRLIKVREHLVAHLPEIEVLYIPADRLQVDVRKRKETSGTVDKESHRIVAANYLAEHLKSRIRTLLVQYNRLTQDLDRTYPRRVLQISDSGPDDELDADKLRSRLDELSRRREDLQNAGLLTRADEEQVVVPHDLDKGLRRALTLYVEDNEKKLAIFRLLARRIEAFQSILKGRFLNKHLVIDQECGFYFVSDNGTKLQPEHLSSGEQHQIVLFYELLFNVRTNYLLLMDEPELSLHAEWQAQFLEDLRRVVAITPIDIVLATHSPLIVSEHTDWMVPLVGVNPDEIPKSFDSNVMSLDDEDAFATTTSDEAEFQYDALIKAWLVDE